MKKIINLLCFLLMGICVLTAQNIQPDLISATAMYQQTDGKAYYVSIGESMISTLSSNDKAVTNGFLQSYPFFTVSYNQVNVESLDVKAYPNPTSNQIQIQLGNLEGPRVSIYVFDQYGRLLSAHDELPVFNKTLQKNLDTSDLSSGIYYIKVLNTKRQNLATIKFSKITDL